MDLLFAAVVGFILAAFLPSLYRVIGDRVVWLLGFFPAAVAGWFLTYLGVVEADPITSLKWEWVPQLGVSFSLRLDGLSLLFVLLISVIGVFVAVYSSGYLAGHPKLGSFCAYLAAFMSSMLGLVLASNLFTLYLFWELTTVTSFLLIGFESQKASARRAAIQSLVTTAGGGLCLLAGLILLGLAGGSFEVPELVDQSDAIRSHHYYPAIVALVLLGAFTKSAQFPFHYWLPNAMEAPTPVSAYLHSATMVKAGIYLLARLTPVLGGTEEWSIPITVVGAVTMVLGAVLAFGQRDLKALLAYLTINVLGTLVMLVGIGTTETITAAIAYLLAHALYKGSLFLIVGAVDHGAHSRDLTELSGLRKRMPLTAAFAILAALSMGGVAPLFGFVSKELYFEGVLHAPGAPFLMAASLVSSIFLVAGAILVGYQPFFGPLTEKADHAHEAGLRVWLPPALLAVAGLVAGLFPQALAVPLVEPAASVVSGDATPLHFALWHGVTLALVLSVVALAGGVGLYFGRAFLLQRSAVAGPWLSWGPAAWYRGAIAGLEWFATWQTGLLQSGYLRVYVILILTAVTMIAGFRISHVGLPNLWRETMGVRLYEAIAVAMILAASLVTVRSRSRFRAILSLAVIGFGVSWLFAIFGGPDLAMTQIVVEALTVLLFVLTFYRLPKFSLLSDQKTRIRDAILAISVGGVITVLLLLATGIKRQPPISEYFVQQSVPKAHGRNVVNVILVDFRAFDTLGEITVLSVAAVGIYALIRFVAYNAKARREGDRL